MAQSLPFKNERSGRTLTEETSFTGGMHYSDAGLDAMYLKSVVNMDYDTVTTNLKTRKPFVPVNVIAEDIANLEFLAALEVPVQNYTIKNARTHWVSDDVNTVYLFGKRKDNETTETFIGASLNSTTCVTADTLGRTHIQLYDVHDLYVLMVDAEGTTHVCTPTMYGFVNDSILPQIETPAEDLALLLKYGQDAPMLSVYGKYVVAPMVERTLDGTYSFRTSGASDTPSLAAFQFYALRDEADMCTSQTFYSYTYFSQDPKTNDDAYSIEDSIDMSIMGSALGECDYTLVPTDSIDANYDALNNLMHKTLANNHWEGYNLLKTQASEFIGCTFNSKANEVHAANTAALNGTVVCDANVLFTANPVQGTDFEITIGDDAFPTVLRIGKISITIGTPEQADGSQRYKFIARYQDQDIGECVLDAAQTALWYRVGYSNYLDLTKSKRSPFAKLLGAFWKCEFRNNQMRVWFRRTIEDGYQGDYTLHWTTSENTTPNKYLNIPEDALLDVDQEHCTVKMWFQDEAGYRTFDSSYRRSSTCLLKEFEVHRPFLYNLIPHTDTYSYPSLIDYENTEFCVIKDLDSYMTYVENIRRTRTNAVNPDEYLREIDTAVRYYSKIFKRLEEYGDPEGLRYSLPTFVPSGWEASSELKDAHAYYKCYLGPSTSIYTDTKVYNMCVDYGNDVVGSLRFTYGHPNPDEAGATTIVYKDYTTINPSEIYNVSCNRNVVCKFGVSLSNMSPYKLQKAFTNGAKATLSLHTASPADVFKELRNTSITTAKNNAYNLIMGNNMYSFQSAADLSAGLAPVVQGVYMLDPDENKVVVTPKIGQYVRLVPIIRLPSNYAELTGSHVRVLWEYTNADTTNTETVWNVLARYGASDEEIAQSGSYMSVASLGTTLFEEEHDDALCPNFLITDAAVLVRCTVELYQTTVRDWYDERGQLQHTTIPYTIGTSIANLTIEPAAYRVLAKAPANLATAQGSTVWNNQLFLWGVYSNNNTLFWSEVDNPCYFPYPINSHEFDAPIRALIPYKTGLIAFTSDACYRLDAAEKGFTVTCIQRGLDIAVEDAKFIKFIKNMVLFKSGSYFYMVVPKATTYYTGELAIAPIYKTIQKFFDEPTETINAVLCEMYPEYQEYILQLTAENTWRLLDTHIEQDVAVLRYGVEGVDSIYFSLRYDTALRQWTTYCDVVVQGTSHVYAYELGNAQEYVVYRNSTASAPGLKALYTYTYGTEGIEDTAYPGVLPERYYIDTGYRKLTEPLKKRFRELQFRMYTPADTDLKFRTKFYVDGMPRRDYDRYSGEVVEDSTGAKTYILTHDYLDYNMIFATDTIDLDESELAGWTLDSSSFATDAPIKVRMACSGKGYAPRLTILSTTDTPFELSGINWVYRIMHGR